MSGWALLTLPSLWFSVAGHSLLLLRTLDQVGPNWVMMQDTLPSQIVFKRVCQAPCAMWGNIFTGPKASGLTDMFGWAITLPAPSVVNPFHMQTLPLPFEGSVHLFRIYFMISLNIYIEFMWFLKNLSSRLVICQKARWSASPWPC